MPSSMIQVMELHLEKNKKAEEVRTEELWGPRRTEKNGKAEINPRPAPSRKGRNCGKTKGDLI